MDLTGKVALVTGSSRGIGRGIALGLAHEGADLMPTGRDETALRDVTAAIEALGRTAKFASLDLRQAEAPAALIAAVRRDYGRLDILVNNAGGSKRGDFFALTDADWQDGYALKFFAHVRLARTAWPMLKEHGGSLITIAGTSGRVPTGSFTIGSSVNAACVAFSKALADLGKQDGVRVNCIHPSLVDTDRQRRRIAAEIARSGRFEADVRAQFCREAGTTRFGTPQDVADLVCFIVSERGSWLHGATIDLDGGEIPVL